MKLGFSIENPALIAKTDSEEKGILLANYNNFEEFLIYLKECGIQSVEIRKLIRYADVKEYKDAIQLIWDLGMEITIHGDVTGDLPYSNFLEVYPSLEYIFTNFDKYQKKLVMPIHAYQTNAGENSTEDLSKQTVEELGRWVDLIEQEGIPLYLALENNRAKDQTVDPGNSVNGVIKMVDEINSHYLGICWDMGHYYSNLLKESNLKELPNRTIDHLPPRSFLEKVYHTHIHGLNHDGKTHFPLTSLESLPLENYITALKKKGYNNVYNLELTFSRWNNQVPIASEIASTIKRLEKVTSLPLK